MTPSDQKLNLAIYLLALPILLSGCAHSIVIPFQSVSEKKLSEDPATHRATRHVTLQATQPADIAVYRSTRPYAAFTELGVISYRSNVYNLAAMYDQLRKDSSPYGTQAIIDVMVTKESHDVLMPVTQCFGGTPSTAAACSTTMAAQNVTTYLIVGSMIREKNE